MIEERLRTYLAAQYEAVPESDVSVPHVSPERQPWLSRPSIVLAAVALVVVVAGGLMVLPRSDRTLAPSPFSGLKLPIVNLNPLIVQGQIGPAPRVAPDGVDLSFTPIVRPTDDDLEAIDETIGHSELHDVTVVALGEIDAFQTRYYAIHGTDGRGVKQSLVLEVGPDFPSTVAVGGPTADEVWLPSGGWSPMDGIGRETLRIPRSQPHFVVLDVDGRIYWQRPSDGFFWIPYRAGRDSVRTLTVYDVETGEVIRSFPNMTFRPPNG